MKSIVLFSGSSHPQLAQAIADNLEITLCDSIHDQFSNGERRIELQENVRRKNVFIIQTGSFDPQNSINDLLMELLLMVNAAKLSDAESITVVCPHFPYSRQDKKDRSRTPVSARIVADMLENAGVSRVVTMDLHANQIQGFFRIPVDNLFARDLLISHLQEHFLDKKDDFILVSPDAGGAKRVLKMAKKLEMSSLLLHKERDHSKKNHVDQTIIVGDESQLQGRRAIIIDDMSDTMGTVIKACDTLVEHGATDVIVCVTHGVLSGPAIDRLNSCKAISALIVSNTIPQNDNLSRSDKIQVFDTAELFATCIRRIVDGGSISELFKN